MLTAGIERQLLTSAELVKAAIAPYPDRCQLFAWRASSTPAVVGTRFVTQFACESYDSELPSERQRHRGLTVEVLQLRPAAPVSASAAVHAWLLLQPGPQ